MKEVIDAAAAARLIQDDWTITTGGFGSCGHPEAMTRALQTRYLREGRPRRLTLIFAAGQGDRGRRGLNRLAHPGLLKRVIGGYWGLTPRLGELARADLIEAYNWPQGVVSHLFRAVAAGAPGVITPIGLHTFLDPRRDGGRLNSACAEALIQLVRVGGREQLLYPAQPIHCALIRGTRADRRGNVTMEEEANIGDALNQAQAAHNSGGIVLVQVREIVPPGALEPHRVVIPGILVDYLVPSEPEDHWQTYGAPFDPAFIGATAPAPAAPRPVDAKTLIARRAYLELLPLGCPVVNLGIGTPEVISEVAAEEEIDAFTLTVESGAVGGRPAGGLSFGASVNPEAILDQPAQFDFYDGGGIDVAFLGFGEADAAGNVNVSRLGDRINGVGGFVNISQSARRLAFCGAFTGGGLELHAADGELRILREGSLRKIVRQVQHLSFCAEHARRQGQPVMYITERAVFELGPAGLVLTEVAPGLDIRRHVLEVAGAPIRCAGEVRPMDPRIFRRGPMSLSSSSSSSSREAAASDRAAS
jgi:propionate CoA-transferase